jgi:hypothetical protein
MSKVSAVADPDTVDVEYVYNIGASFASSRIVMEGLDAGYAYSFDLIASGLVQMGEASLYRFYKVMVSMIVACGHYIGGSFGHDQSCMSIIGVCKHMEAVL